MSSFHELLARKLQNPTVAAGFNEAQQRHDLRQELVQMRKTHGITQRELADRMGVSQSTVAGFETEDADPRFSTIQRYCRAIGYETVVSFAQRPVDLSWVDAVVNGQKAVARRDVWVGAFTERAGRSTHATSRRSDFARAA